MMRKVRKVRGQAPVTPRIRNVMELRGRTQRSTLLHCTAKQWQAATKGMTAIKAAPKTAAALEAVPLPGRPGERIIGPRCPPGCEPVMRYRRAGTARKGRFSSVGYTPHPDDIIIPECICPPDEPDLPGGGQPGTQRSGCRFVLRFRAWPRRAGTPPRVPAMPIFTCETTTCQGECRLESRRRPDGVIEIYCACRRR